MEPGRSARRRPRRRQCFLEADERLCLVPGLMIAAKSIIIFSARSSVTLPGHACTASAYKKIQIRAAIGLQHVVVIELIVTTSKNRVRRLPLCATALDLRLGDVQMKTPCGHVQFDHVPIPDQPQNSPCCRLG